MKVLLVGRHTPDFGQEDVEVLEIKNVQFAARSQEVQSQVAELISHAAKIDAEAVLFQAVPGQLAVALAKIASFRTLDWHEGSGEEPAVQIGVIISKPGAREAAKTMHVVPDLDYASGYKKVAEFCNPNAKITSLDDSGYGDDFVITVDAPMKFEFSHIEWI